MEQKTMNNKIMNNMNKIGLILLTTVLLIGGACSSQNFFWSHTYIPEDDTVTVNYGYLYNWYVVLDARNVAPAGWHVSDAFEHFALRTYLGGASVAGGKVKTAGTTFWNTPNTGATNEVGFNSKGNGVRTNVGGFTTINTVGTFWAGIAPSSITYAETTNTGTAWGSGSTTAKAGCGIRLVKDATTLTEGQTSWMTGNDGKVYQTICINGKEWTSENICETKYRNGDAIPKVTDNSAWAALTSGAYCSYGNNDSNALE